MINPEILKEIRNAIDTSFKDIEAKYGIQIRGGNARFTKDIATMKVNIRTLVTSGTGPEVVVFDPDKAALVTKLAHASKVPPPVSKALLGYAKGYAKQLGLNWQPIQIEMTSNNYKNLIKVFDKHFGKYVDLER